MDFVHYHSDEHRAQKAQAMEEAHNRLKEAEAQVAHFEQRMKTELRAFPVNWENPEFMSTRLPPPTAEKGWLSEGPTRFADQSRGTPANWDSHVNGFRAELKLANHLAEHPEAPEHVVFWGHRANEQGTDLISVTQKGEVVFYDAKYASDGRLVPIPDTGESSSWVNKPNEFSAVAISAIRNSETLGEHQSTALNHLKDGNYTVVFVTFNADFEIVGEQRISYRNGVRQK